MTKIYNKLVRDRIPEIIRAEGRESQIEIMPEEEYLEALRKKLIEEAQEVSNAHGDALVSELADLMEVMDALMLAYGISPQNVLEIKAQRHKDRGGFSQRIKLVETSD